MSLRLLIGRAGSGKSDFCLGEIAENLKENIHGSNLLYIVPEQAAFRSEYRLITREGLEGSIRAQALSFKRLSWKVMQELGGRSRLFIDDSGKSMLLRKIVEKNRPSLNIFKHAAEQKGILDNLVQFYNEMKRSCFTLTDISGVTEYLRRKNDDLSPLLSQKLEELMILFEEVEDEFKGKYLDSEDYLNLLAYGVPQSPSLKNSLVWIDGFYGFTNLEFRILKQFIRYLPSVTVSLTLDKDYVPEEKIDDLNPFYPTAVTCQHLQEIADRYGIEVEKKSFLNEESFRFKNKPALYYLEQQLNIYPVKPYMRNELLPLQLISALDPRNEIEAVAHKISTLVRNGCRFHEIAVIVSDMDLYRDFISTVFKDYDIPYFLDQQRNLLHHPLIEFIRSSMDVVNNNWSYESVFRCIKTDFLIAHAAGKEKNYFDLKLMADKLENYVLALGIQGQHYWLYDGHWEYKLKDVLEKEKEDRTDEEERIFLAQINEIRKIITEPLRNLQKRFKLAKTVEEKTRALFYLLNDAAVYEQIQQWSDEASKNGDMEKAREHLQAYKSVIDVLDQIVEIMGEEELSTSFYADILETGLENLRLSMVPPSLDQVEIGDVSRSRCENVKYSFLVGLNEGLFPARPVEDGIFTEKERDTLLERDIEIYPSSRRNLLDQQFLIYIALTRAKSGLYLSYSSADEEGRAVLPSLLVHRLKEIFPSLEEEYSGAAIDSFVHPREALSKLLLNFKNWKYKTPIHPVWWDVYNWFCCSEEWNEKASRAFKGICYHNKEYALSDSSSRELYGDNIQTSISALEKYNACPFAHFVSYGLRLQERERYSLEIPDIGRFFHAVLRNLTRSLMKEGKDFADLSYNECYELTALEAERLLPRLQKEILLSSRRYQFLAEKIKNAVGQAVYILSDHSRKTKFKPFEAELSFGKKGDLPPLCVDIGDKKTLELVGRIDRVDLARGDDGTPYIRVIDYKSGQPQFKLMDIYYGLSLQLLAYQEAVLYGASHRLGEEVKPAGMLYFQLYSPVINSDKVLSAEEARRELFKRYKMKGLVLADLDVVCLMDSTVKSGHSQIIPVGITKKGGFFKNSSVIDGEKLAFLRGYFKESLKKWGSEISAGNVEISPYRLGSKKACNYCTAQEVCQFDPLLEGNSFRSLKKGTGEEALSWMREYNDR